MAKAFLSLGYQVKGSTTNQHKREFLRQQGIEAFWVQADPCLLGEDIKIFFDSHILILTIPFRRDLADPKFYQQQIQSVIDELQQSPVEFVVFTSSTLVYPAHNRLFSEEDSFVPDNERAEVLLAAERQLLYGDHFDTTILRLGGLYGFDRQLGKFLAGRTHLKEGHQPVNLIHQDDAVAIITEIIRQDIRGEIFNACCDEHPTKKELYTFAARKLGLVSPQFTEDSQRGFKIINNEKLKRTIGYHFKHPTPME